jgi:hypothetical protein
VLQQCNVDLNLGLSSWGLLRLLLHAQGQPLHRDGAQHRSHWHLWLLLRCSYWASLLLLAVLLLLLLLLVLQLRSLYTCTCNNFQVVSMY